MTVTIDERGNRHDTAGRFATKACPRVYALLDAITEPVPFARPEGGWSVPAPKCPHGSFLRWARANCKPCLREARS